MESSYCKTESLCVAMLFDWDVLPCYLFICNVMSLLVLPCSDMESTQHNQVHCPSYVVCYFVTHIKSEIIKVQKARKTLGKLNWAIQLSSFL